MQNGGQCVNKLTGFTCACASGWTGSTCTTQLTTGLHIFVPNPAQGLENTAFTAAQLGIQVWQGTQEITAGYTVALTIPSGTAGTFSCGFSGSGVTVTASGGAACVLTGTTDNL